MIKVKEGEAFACEECGKEWKVQICMENSLKYVCGNKVLAKTLPEWAGCGHLNQVSIIR